MDDIDSKLAVGAIRSRLPLAPITLGGFLVAAIAVVVIAFFSYESFRESTTTATRVTRTLEMLEQLESLLSSVKDAETGQRGYLLTGAEPYLAPYVKAAASLPTEIKSARALSIDNPPQLRRIDMLEQLVTEKMAELAETIVLRRANRTDAALDVVRTERGRTAMQSIRELITEAENSERRLLVTRQQEFQRASMISTRVSWGGSLVLLTLILIAAAIASRDHLARQRLAWIRSGQMGISRRIQGEQRLEILSNQLLEYLAGYLDAQVGAVYVTEPDGRFRRVAGYAVPASYAGEVLRPGDGLLGQAVKENRALHVRHVPDGYLPVGSSLGESRSAELLVAPASVDGEVQAVIELGFLRPVLHAERELLDRVSESLGVAVRSSKDRSRLEALLEETQRQGEELQTQQEELRVSNEELEEQSRILKESQGRLEAQHAEMEQTNSQLEEQSQLLEHQKDELSSAQTDLLAKAADLERSNQYKSEFLANMSHELRTPLNSSLILSKLLADNKQGNLTVEQVKFAQTISDAGNDLLALINDILDLSKIEAGKVDIDVESVSVAGIVESMVKTMQPVARQKALALNWMIEPGTPERMETDAQRLGQILKNLLSNALKFTEKGEVALRVFATSSGELSFAVRDTGIGIPANQHGFIFEAFRQADGSTHRRYGGTGLGLSISRDLARLLGGDIELQSSPGAGSVFTLTLPVMHAPASEARTPAQIPMQTPTPTGKAVAPRSQPALPAPAAWSGLAASTGALKPGHVDDDRDSLGPESRVILVIEDDERFAAILRDVVRERGFKCVVTHSAGDGLAATALCRPKAILLDMNLPDHSGLGVLDQLKRNPATRHIPVHVASVADYSHEALELGAVGYALKPVKREQLIEALERLESKFSQAVRHVLVVEDDPRQRESIRQLLGSSGDGGRVEITAVANAAAALSALQSSTFDCMVIDLNLPDLSGYELLEKMAGQDEVSFPPVIVYTGRSLSRDEEQKLRRYSRSIIIKDARSPERLLDEVTLFLHQVESKLPAEQQSMLKTMRDREATLQGRRILVVEDDVRNIFALSSILEPQGAKVEIARNGLEALDALAKDAEQPGRKIDLVLMDIMMPEMDGMTAMREIRKRAEWRKLPIIALTAKAMRDDQEQCMAAGANDYIAKPLDVEKLLSLVRVWMPK